MFETVSEKKLHQRGLVAREYRFGDVKASWEQYLQASRLGHRLNELGHSEMWSSICSHFGVQVKFIRVIFCKTDAYLFDTNHRKNHVVLTETELWDR